MSAIQPPTPLGNPDPPFRVDFEGKPDSKRYLIDGARYDRVTGLIDGAMAKEWLAPWAAKRTAEDAVNEQDTWLKIAEDEGLDEAIDWLKKARFRTLNAAGDRGTFVHRAAEAHILGMPLEELDPAAAKSAESHQFGEEMAAHARHLIDEVLPPEVWLHTEVVCYSDSVGYAGTMDGIVELPCSSDDDKALLMSMGLPIDEKAVVPVDWKTARFVSSEYALQLAAYRWAERLLAQDGDGSWVSYPNFPGRYSNVGLVLHVRPEGWAVVPVNVSKDSFDAFRSAAGVTRWAKGRAKQAIRSVPVREARQMSFSEAGK